VSDNDACSPKHCETAEDLRYLGEPAGREDYPEIYSRRGNNRRQSMTELRQKAGGSTDLKQQKKRLC